MMTSAVDAQPVAGHTTPVGSSPRKIHRPYITSQAMPAKKKLHLPIKPEQQALPIAAPTQDECRVTSYAVGHGDCTLVEYHRDGRIAFRCLVDGGTSLPDALVKYLKRNPREDSGPDIDALVLSHVDNDHQGGLPQLLDEGLTIGEYLGPCLPTFERLGWLFAPRVAEAVQRARSLEDRLDDAGVPITYPMEGYVRHHADRRVTLSVISPASRLLKWLSTRDGAELASLLSQPTLPLQWLLESAPEPEPAGQDALQPDVFEGRVSLTPAELRGTLNATTLQPKEIKEAARDRGLLLEPEFFGNAVLNDTSLVLVIDVQLDSSCRKRLLLTGDQENWTYIAARHPVGLGIDVLKAPHHGGRLYLADRQEDYLWLRPRTVLVSANGQHKLPRSEFRDALRRIGATLVCPNVRGAESLAAGSVLVPGQDSCFKTMGCRPDQPSTTLTLRSGSEVADRPACVQGSGSTSLSPIIVLNQHVTAPSEALVRYTQGELENHARWLTAHLRERHRMFMDSLARDNPDVEWSQRASQRPVPWETIAANARKDGRLDLVYDPEPVIAYALSRRMFWANRARPNHRHGELPLMLYRSATPREAVSAWNWLQSVPRILLCSTIDRSYRPSSVTDPVTDEDLLNVDRIAFLRKADWTIPLGLIAGYLCIPAVVVQEQLLDLLLLDLAEHFSLRICSKLFPQSERDSFSGSAYHSAVYFLLERRTQDEGFPNVYSEEWLAVWKAPPRPWRRLFELASKSLLAGNFDERGSGAFWPNDFYYGYNNKFDSRIGEYIDNAYWHKVWR